MFNICYVFVMCVFDSGRFGHSIGHLVFRIAWLDFMFCGTDSTNSAEVKALELKAWALWDFWAHLTKGLEGSGCFSADLDPPFAWGV